MRSFIRFAFIYALCGLAGGVFFREYTRILNYTGPTTLKLLHPHLFVLGAGMFLICAILQHQIQLSESRHCKAFLITYNVGLIWTVAMLLVRGIWQVQGLSDSPAISGMAGLGHIILAVGILYFFAVLFSRVPVTANPNGHSRR